MKSMHDDIKGMLATIGSVGAAITAWMPFVEFALRVGASLGAIAAGYYAAKYWRWRFNNKDKKD